MKREGNIMGLSSLSDAFLMIQELASDFKITSKELSIIIKMKECIDYILENGDEIDFEKEIKWAKQVYNITQFAITDPIILEDEMFAEDLIELISQCPQFSDSQSEETELVESDSIEDDSDNTVKEIDPDMIELIESFISESIDLLEQAESKIEILSPTCEIELINNIFRSFHSLKGMAGFLEYNVFKEVTHKAETLLDKLRKNPNIIIEQDKDILYQVCDQLAKIVSKISKTYMEPKEFNLSDLVELIQNRIETIEKSGRYGEEVYFDDLIKKDTVEKYIQHLYDSFESIENLLGELEDAPQNQEKQEDYHRLIHNLKGNSSLIGFHQLEEIFIQIEELNSCFLKSDNTIPSNLYQFYREIFNDLENDLAAVQFDDKKVSLKIRNKTKISKDLIDLKAKKIWNKPLGEILVLLGEASPQGVQKALDIQAKNRKALDTIQDTSSQKIERKDIRVQMDKLDHLFNLVGELITIEAMINNNKEMKELNIPSFFKSANMLNKVTREIQEVTTSMRMTPLEGIFFKMKRLVRDLSKKMDKPIHFIVSGEETEMDKNIIQELSDPLIHILRNSLDHGIESIEERKKKEKSEKGRIELKADYEGNEIMIEIIDDGKGLDREKILNKAEKNGLLKVPAESLSDSEVWRIIFEPGFSTADVVSDISGRGVGMDVVKKNIEKLRGTIDIDSAKDKGTRFRLRIPLTLAVMDVMLLRVGTHRYAIPITSVKESFRPSRNMISKTMDGQEVVKVRNEIYTVVRLYEFYEQESENKDLENGILVMIENRIERICLFVDEIIGQQQTVVKGLSEYIGKKDGITGCMILSDGDIGLIIDIESLILAAKERE